MTLLASTELTLIFSFWRIYDIESMFLSCLLVFALAFLHEGFQKQRLLIDQRYGSLLEKSGYSDESGPIGTKLGPSPILLRLFDLMPVSYIIQSKYG